MASIVVNGDTSGAVTLSAPATAGTVTVTLPATSGTMLTTASSTGISGSAISSGTVPEAYGGTGTSTGYYGFKNRIINGAMVISQRNGTSSVTPSGGFTYTLDRWQYGADPSGKVSIQQNAGSVTPPVGFTNYLGVTSLSAYTAGSSEQINIEQHIEGFNVADLAWGTANAKTVTLSFQVYSSLTGTFSGSLVNGSGNRSYPFSYTISSANTWTTASVTIAGDTTGTWATGNTAGVVVFFNLGCGSTFLGTAGAWTASEKHGVTGSVSVVGTNGATFYITGVQLEKGSTATSFDYRPYGTELQLCYRYAWNYSSALSSNGAYLRYLTVRCTNSTGTAGTLILPVEMRTTPTLTTTGTASNYAINFPGANIACTTVPAVGGDGSSRFQVNLEANVASGLTGGYAAQLMSNNNQTSYLLFSAEL